MEITRNSPVKLIHILLFLLWALVLASCGAPILTNAVAPPASISAVTSGTAVSLTWTASSTAAPSGYLLVRSTSGTVSFLPANGVSYPVGAIDSDHTVIYSGATASYADAGVVAGRTYAYGLFAYDANYNYSTSRTGTYVAGCDNLASGATFAGAGTSDDPYIICTAAQLMQIGTTTAYLAAQYRLVADLDFSAYDNSVPALTVASIGSYDISGSATQVPFTGVFDGGSHVISHLTIDRHVSNYAAGLFNYTSGATIKNLTLSSATVTGYSRVGALVGNALNTDITHVTVSGTVSGTRSTAILDGNSVGLVVGIATVSGAGNVAHLDYVVGSGTVYGRDAVGGVVANLYALSSGAYVVDHSSFTGSVLPLSGGYGNTAGGFIGYLSTSGAGTISIANSSFSGTVTATGSWNGGFFSTTNMSASGGSVTISNCSASGSISTSGATQTAASNSNFNGSCLGGFGGAYGNANSGTLLIQKSWADMAVNYSGNFGASGIGGFVACVSPSTGTSTQILKSYSKGTVTTNSATSNRIGGFIGYANSGSARAQITDAYTTATVSAPNSDYVGGFSGDNGALLTNVYASSAVTGSGSGTRIGGFTGNNAAAVIVTASYWNTDLKATGSGGTGNTSGFSGVNAAGLLDPFSFVGWNFTTIWNPATATTFPTLR